MSRTGIEAAVASVFPVVCVGLLAGACASPPGGEGRSREAALEVARPQGLRASYRKDAYLPKSVYNEYTETPTKGGRFHLAGVAAVSGRVTRILVDGVDLDATARATKSPQAEWYHVWPRHAEAGRPLWVAFHSRSAAWDRRTASTLRVETDAGVALEGPFAVAKTPAPLTYVTTTDDLTAQVVHLQNRSASAVTPRRVWLDGEDVSALVPGLAAPIAPAETRLWVIPRREPATLGAAWTVVVEIEGRADSVGVGRVVPPRFPIETWNNTSECPWPGANAANLARMKGAAIDTLYVHPGTCEKCGCDTATLLGRTLPENPGLFALAEHGAMMTVNLATTSAIAGIATGDESDGEVYGEDGAPKPNQKADKSREAWDRYPELPTFNGGKTNGNIGTFAGMADIQGMDLYAAACAPHITPWGNHPPLRGPYDYLRNTRENHMPQPTWLYTQGLHDGWNQKPVFRDEYLVQPTETELIVQAYQAIAAGAKGLMWFQVSEDVARRRPRRWEAIAQVNRVVRAVRPELRVGDPTGLVDTESDSLAEVIHAPDALVVPVINMKVKDSVDDLKCGAGFVSGDFPHWTLRDNAVTFTVRLPAGFTAADVFEVTPGGVVDAAAAAQDGRVRFDEVPLSQERPARLFVVAATPEVRARVAARF